MVINNIIKIQRLFRRNRKKLIKIRKLFIFQKKYLLEMQRNIIFLTRLNILFESDSNYLCIINELKEINNILETINEIRMNNLNSSLSKINSIQDLIIKYSNHCCSLSLKSIFELFKYEENNDIIDFLLKYFHPICLWTSNYHKNIIPYENNDNILVPLNKKNNTSNIIESILSVITKEKENSLIKIPNNALSPTIIKNITDIMDKENKKLPKFRNFHWSLLEIIKLIENENENIKIIKNTKLNTMYEEKNSACIIIKLKNDFLVIEGIFYDDLIGLIINEPLFQNKLLNHKKYLKNTYINQEFVSNYLNIIPIRDIIILSSEEIKEEIEKKYNDFKQLINKTLIVLINDFLLASKQRKVDILTLLLISNFDDKKLAWIIFDIWKSKDKHNQTNEVYNSLHCSIRKELDIAKNNYKDDEIEIEKLVESDIPYEKRISLLKCNSDVKVKAIEKLKLIKSSIQGDSKAQNWLDGLLKIPFETFSTNSIIEFKNNFINKIKEIDSINLYSDNDIDLYIDKLNNELLKDEWTNYKRKRIEYIKSVRNELDKAVYGHNEAKLQLERLFAQWINGSTKGAVLGLQGPPGTGKTSLAKNGLSKCLVDDTGKPRPFAFLPIGGSVNGSTLVGHSYTYVGSTWGRIVDILIITQCMNPIIFIDELDKVSQTEHGREIISVLTHLTDSTQNDEWEDKFFSGIKLDLSKALIVFSFNDPTLIDPILKDRITIIETHPLKLQEKLTIIRDYTLPEVCKQVGFNPSDIVISDEIITWLINTYTNEAGIRKIKERITEIIQEINLKRFINIEEYILPFVVTKNYIKILFENKRKVRIKKIHNKPMIGLVNGLYATSMGIGGITPIQILKFPSDKMLDIQVTGKAGEIMKESVQYSLKVAWSLLNYDKQESIINSSNFAIHLHCPDGATPKDGPSAGAAFTLAIYSLLVGKPILNTIAMTGEIDLLGNITAIGGLESKISGAKKANCNLVLIPKENEEDLILLRKKNLIVEDENFKVVMVSNIEEIIKYAI
jgi:ATP-dependent Lon protease